MKFMVLMIPSRYAQLVTFIIDGFVIVIHLISSWKTAVTFSFLHENKK